MVDTVETQETTQDTLRRLHDDMAARGLFTGGMERYWYSIWDALVYELAPEMADE